MSSQKKSQDSSSRVWCKDLSRHWDLAGGELGAVAARKQRPLALLDRRWSAHIQLTVVAISIVNSGKLLPQVIPLATQIHHLLVILLCIPGDQTECQCLSACSAVLHCKVKVLGLTSFLRFLADPH